MLRQRVKVLLAAGICTIAGACGGSDTASDTAGEVDSSQTSEQEAATPVVDRLVLALGPVSPETNRSWLGIDNPQLQMEPYLEGLLKNDATTAAAIPALAESWTVSSDSRVWTFQLRKGVQWHHGWGEFTSDDVIFSHGLWTQEASIMSQRPRWLTATVTASGPYEVTFNFENPAFDGDQLFSRTRAAGFIYSKAQYDKEGFDGYDLLPAGTGPYMYKERVLGEYIRFERNPDHWSGVLADFPEMEFIWQPEPTTRLALLLSGTAHFADLGREFFEPAEAGGMAVLSANTASLQSYMYFGGIFLQEGGGADLTDPIAASKEVRQALNKAIDKKEILEVVYKGGAQPLYRAGFIPGSEGWDDRWVSDFESNYGYDPEAAIELIKAAGYEPSDITTTITVFQAGGNPEWSFLAEVVQSYLAAIGINVTIENRDFEIIRQTAATETNGRTITPFRNTPIRFPQEWVRFFNTPDAAWPSYKSDFIADQYPGWEASTDANERDELARSIGNHLYDNFSDIPIASVTKNLVYNPSVVGGWELPGVTSSGLSNFDEIKRATK